jgi:CRP-like cAMP-binding protein
MRYGPNEVLVRQGVMPDGIFLLMDGECLLQKEIVILPPEEPC